MILKDMSQLWGVVHAPNLMVFGVGEPSPNHGPSNLDKPALKVNIALVQPY